MEQQKKDEIKRFVSELGMPGLTGGQTNTAPGGGGVSRPGEVAGPDMTQMVPTTTDPKKLSASLQILLLLSLLTLAPSILLMTTCFTRIVIVMSLLRQALGAAQLPPNQVLIGLSLFMTFLVMGPTWSRVNQNAIGPYNDGKITQMEAFNIATGELRGFMINQIRGAHNEDDVYLFYGYAHPDAPEPQEWKDVEKADTCAHCGANGQLCFEQTETVESCPRCGCRSVTRLHSWIT